MATILFKVTYKLAIIQMYTDRLYTYNSHHTSLSSINIQACKKLEGDLADLEIQAQENDKMKKIVQDHLLREKSKSSF